MNVILLLLLSAPQVMLDHRFEDFRLPTTHTSSWWLSVSPVTLTANGRGQGFYLPAGIGYSTQLNGDALCHSFQAQASTDLSAHAESAIGAWDLRTVLLTGDDEVDAYPLDAPLLVGLSAGTYTSLAARNVDREHSLVPLRSRHVSMSLGPRLGAGRLRDARPVVQALWIEEVLKQEGILSRDLDDAELQHLAQLITSREAYRRLHEHGARYFFQAVEDRLRASAGNSAVPARTWLRIRDVLNYAGKPVQTGLQVTAGLRNSWFFDYDGTTYPESSVVRDTSSRSALFSFSVKSGHPFTPHVRFSESFEYNLPLESGEREPYLTTDVRLIDEVNEVWLVQAWWSASYASLVGPGLFATMQTSSEAWSGPRYDYLSHGPAASLTYYAEDHLRVTGGASLNFTSYLTSPYAGARVSYAAACVSFAVAWRL